MFLYHSTSPTSSVQNPAAEINVEQTASLLSMLTFSFLDPVIRQANRVPHLPADQFPPLPDYDYSKILVQRSLKVRALHGQCLTYA